MNNTIQNIINRRSTRKFLKTPLMESELNLILEAGQSAPSAKNEQPWQFTVVQSKDLLDRLGEKCKEYLIKTDNPVFRRKLENSDLNSFNLFYHAPVLIIISGNIQATDTLIGCTLAAENMIITTESLGLGSCWIQAVKLFSDIEEGRGFLVKSGVLLPDYEVVASIVFGHKADSYQTPGIRKRDNVIYL